MTLVVAFDDIKTEQVRRKTRPDKPGSPANTTNHAFFRASAQTPDAPTAFINRYNGENFSTAHFHAVDQFQIIVDGKGTFGHHAVEPYVVHFSRAYTPYGPLHSDKETGWAFMTLRARYDPGAQRLPESQPALLKVAQRRPWQISKKVAFPTPETGVNLLDDPDIRDNQGLYTGTLTMAPNTTIMAPDPSAGDGQFVIVLKGSLLHDGRQRRAPTVVFVKPSEPAFEIRAGAEGLEALVLNFPSVVPRAAESPAASGTKKWQCVLCAFAYDEALGMPDEGIAPGTRWEDVPETWTCPDCGATKGDFEMVEV